jgi:hypothetical protein
VWDLDLIQARKTNFNRGGQITLEYIRDDNFIQTVNLVQRAFYDKSDSSNGGFIEEVETSLSGIN